MDAKLAKLVAEVQDAAARLADIQKSPRRPVLHGPPAPAAVTRRVRRFPIPPPPSYRSFLEAHNGWENVWGTFSVIGADGAATKAALEDVKISVEEDGYAVRDAFPAGRKDRYVSMENKNRKFIFLPNHIVFATDFNGQLGVFDRRTIKSKTGEIGVVIWSPDGIAERHASFADLLGFVLADTKKRIRNASRK